MAILTTKTGFVSADSDAQAAPDHASWQQHMKWAVRSAKELEKRLNLTKNEGNRVAGLQLRQNPVAPVKQQTRQHFLKISKPEDSYTESPRPFPVFVPLPYLDRIQPGKWNDPLLLQVLPTAEEDETASGYSLDPLGESLATRGPGLLQKYQGRALLIATGACAVNCRYCFRRHFPYEESPKSPLQWMGTIEQIANDRSIEEIILSGGDPLTLVDENLAQLFDQLDAISHLKRLRIHTRLPIMIPQRVTHRLLQILTNTRLQVITVIHSNHPRELDIAVQIALENISRAGVTLLNQSVLLHRINDQAEILIDLSQRLLECGVLPYYLHKNDPVAGTAHFEVSVERGIELIEQMRAKLPGYAVPRFVQEIAGQPSKTVLA